LIISFDNSLLKPSLTFKSSTLIIETIDGTYLQAAAAIPAAALEAIKPGLKRILKGGKMIEEESSIYSLYWQYP